MTPLQTIEIPLWKDTTLPSTLTCHLHQDHVTRPAMLVIPGGGYGFVCSDTEGYPIANVFDKLGFQTFILKYRVNPYPNPQLDALRAIRLIRHHAAEWGVDPKNLAVCGFSAGGHLTACCGTLYQELDAVNGDDADQESQRPDAILLSYPVITCRRTPYVGSGQNLLKERFEELRDAMSMENRVTPETPPAFIWATRNDQLVPFENSILFAQQMWAHNNICELHIFPDGPHGMSEGYERSDINLWPQQAKEFLHNSAHFHFPEEKKKRHVILTFDDAVLNHRSFVAPLLKEYGFGATFFPCRFTDEWRSLHEGSLLSAAGLKEIHDMGFEIGNHTWNHYGMQDHTDEENGQELDRMEKFLTDAGIPAPCSFAYPGGPYAENAKDILLKRGLKFARTTEQAMWEPGVTDPLRIPGYALREHYNEKLVFYQVLAKCTEKNAAVFVFHGIPDLVHPHVNIEPKTFRYMMDYLKENEFTVCSIRDYARLSSL